MSSLSHRDKQIPPSQPTASTSIRLTRASRLRGDFRLPGDKSISHRSAMLAAIGEGTTRLHNYSSARDCQSTLDCLAALGVSILREPERIVIEGVGLAGLRPASR